MMMEEKNVGGWTAILSLSLSQSPPPLLSLLCGFLVGQHCHFQRILIIDKLRQTLITMKQMLAPYSVD